MFARGFGGCSQGFVHFVSRGKSDALDGLSGPGETGRVDRQDVVRPLDKHLIMTVVLSALRRGGSIFISSALFFALVGCGTSVHDDVARGDIDAVKRKVERDSTILESTNELGKTPLHYAVTFAQREAMEYLIAQGADVSAADGTGLTPLHVAAIVDVRGAARLLLEAGAAMDAKDSFGDTPLHSAAMHGSMRVLEFLLEREADPSMTNLEGLRPLELARRYEQAEAVDRLAGEDGPD